MHPWGFKTAQLQAWIKRSEQSILKSSLKMRISIDFIVLGVGHVSTVLFIKM